MQVCVKRNTCVDLDLIPASVAQKLRNILSVILHGRMHAMSLGSDFNEQYSIFIGPVQIIRANLNQTDLFTLDSSVSLLKLFSSYFQVVNII